MEFIEVFNPTFNSSLKLSKNGIDTTDSKRKNQCFSSFMNEALNRDKLDRKSNNLANNNIHRVKKINRLDNKVVEFDKVNKTDNTDKSNGIEMAKDKNTFENEELTSKADEKVDNIKKQPNNEKIELKNQNLEKLIELISDLFNQNGGANIQLQQILKMFESNSLDSTIFENNSNGKTDIDLSSFEMPKINNINEVISLLNSLLESNREVIDINSLTEDILDNLKFKELLDDLKKQAEVKSMKPTVHQDTGNNLGLTKVNLDSDNPNIDNIYSDKTETDTQGIFSQSEESIDILDDSSKKSNYMKIQENNKEIIKDLKYNISISDENHSYAIDTTKLQNNKPENILEQQKIQKNHIFEQIIDKAKFITKGDFSELKIQLKPESLGKLTLSLILDKGVMTARFVTENNQVKEVIESNFSELKDILQEKGINIQNLSVSVGQDGRWSNDKNGFRAWKNSIKQSSYNRIADLDLEQNMYDIEQSNPYNLKEGTLDIKV